MQKLQIEGGRPLNGIIHIDGAKNSLLPIMTACLMVKGTVLLHNVPKISDLTNMLHILSKLGCKINIKDSTVKIDVAEIMTTEIEEESAKKIRGSVFVMGAMLSRMGKVKLPFPGGCSIGNRPIDIHLDLLKQLGAKVTETKSHIKCKFICKANKKPKLLTMDFPSVGATENIIQATALGCLGNTYQIVGVAKEPEVVDLCNFLNCCGANIIGAGTDTITVHSVPVLHGTEYTPIPDRINTGSYMIATVVCGGNVLLKNTISEHNQNLINKLKSIGVKVVTTNDTIRIIATTKKKRNNFNIHTAPYPGFSTDLQSQFATLATVTKGKTVITESLFENRFRYADELTKLGANIKVQNGKAVIKGVDSLTATNTHFLCPSSFDLPLQNKCDGTTLSAYDLRGGVALVIAALSAKGTTTILNAEYIYRGHQDIVKDLRQVGANILSIAE